MTVDRRSLLRMSALLGVALVLPGATSGPAAPVPPDAVATLTALADTILPATDTPGASQAGVVPFILTMVADWFDAGERDRFWSGYAAFDAGARQRYGRPVVQLSADERTAFVEAGLAVPSSPPGFLDLVKRLTVFGYYTSEIGASQELTYNMAADYVPSAPVDPTEHAPALGRRFHTFSAS